MSQAKNIDRSTAAEYATHSDFCRIFAEDMSSLYLLSLLLTADQRRAEVCFASALGDCLNSGRVFKEWGRSWARRAVIQSAIRLAGPQLQRTQRESRSETRVPFSSGIEPLAPVTKLNPFERFVFVMSVLEGCSDQDCAVLLSCRRQQVVDARMRALQHLAMRGDHRFVPTEFALTPLVAEIR